MRKETSFMIYPLLIMGVFLIFTSSCKKDDENVNNTGIPVLTTTAVTNITQTTAICGGIITSDGGATVTDCGICWSTDQTPTISDNKTTEGTGTGNFASNISGLSDNTTYYVRAYATNSNGTGYGSDMSFTTQQGTTVGSFTDTRDGNVYQTVTIGDQVWMAENLRYLPGVVGPGTASDITAYYYVYGYNGTNVADAKATSNYTTYGVLYNWPAAMNGETSSTTNPSGVQGVCPTGWHLPSDAEWTELTNYLGGESVAGGKLKEIGLTHWISPNTGATNETGFTALPGGFRFIDDTFNLGGTGGCWWSATEATATSAWYRAMNSLDNVAHRISTSKELGFSIRCVRD